jgi:hypothetical protein
MVPEVLNVDVLEAMFMSMPTGQRAVLCSVVGDPATVEGYAWGGTPWARGGPCILPPTRNNYVAISSFCPSEADGRYRRRKDQFGAVHAIMVDDVGTKLALDSLPNTAQLAPSMVVETSPGNFQVTYFLARPVEDQEYAESAVRQMIERLTGGGADPGMSGVTRVLRLPVGVNGKAKYKDASTGAVWSTRLRYWRPDIRIPWEHLCHAFGVSRQQRAFAEPDDAVTVERKRCFGVVLAGLESLRAVRKRQRGWLDIRCPWINEHTDRGDTGAAVAYPATSNGWMGGYRCHHGHCAGRSWGDLEDWVFRQVIERGRATRQPLQENSK